MLFEPDKKIYLTAGVMTGTTAIGGTALHVIGRGMAVFHCVWTSTAVGVFTVHGSNNNSDWFALDVVIPRHPAGAADNIMIFVPCVTQYLKVTYTNASSTGVLDISVVTTPYASSVEVSRVVLPGVVVAGQNTDIDAAAEQLTSTSTPLRSGVTIKALPGNSDQIYIGAVGVTITTGIPLDADQSVFLEIDNLNKVYAIGGAANQGVSWLGS